MDPMHHVPAVQHHVSRPQRHEEGPGAFSISGEAGGVDPQAAAIHLGTVVISW